MTGVQTCALPILESPLIDSPHFKHLNKNSTFLTPEDYPAVDDLIDWIVDQQKQGVKVVNQRDRLLQMKTFMRGHTEPWGCRAGINTLIIRTDGTLAPCFPMYSATYDWGVAGAPKFDRQQLATMKLELHPEKTRILRSSPKNTFLGHRLPKPLT